MRQGLRVGRRATNTTQAESESSKIYSCCSTEKMRAPEVMEVTEENKEGETEVIKKGGRAMIRCTQVGLWFEVIWVALR